MTFDDILEKYRSLSLSEREKGTKFEQLMLAWLMTERTYSTIIDKVWMWVDFPYRMSFGSGKDTGIDLVAHTKSDEYWAVQCKCYAADTTISKADVDTFISTSGKNFTDEDGHVRSFSSRLWIDTSSRWTTEAENLIKGQAIKVNRVTYDTLCNKSVVDWEKLENSIHGQDAVSVDRELRPHQLEALNAFHEHFKTADRGRLIMACGTGKTFTSLRIAENEVPEKGLALFLVPSIALLNQTLIEWMTFAKRHIYPICICSDPDASKRKKGSDESSAVDLAMPATTDPRRIAQYVDKARKGSDISMIVVFSTYQSIEQVSIVQEALNRRAKDSFIFDLVICDEAHRTTGIAYKNSEGTTVDESSFIRVHDNKFINAKKRIYMTATPRLYTAETKAKAKSESTVKYLCSMDDEKMYGKEVYRIGFGKAVSLELLSDYKVLVLTVEEDSVPEELTKSIDTLLADIKDEKKREKERAALGEYIAKLIGSTNALSKRLIFNADLVKKTDPGLMKTAVAFCQNIRISKTITKVFNACAAPYNETLPESLRSTIVDIEAKHIDGTMGAVERQRKLKWLKDVPNSPDDNKCHILTNVRCLSEGVDVPTLDAVIFLSRRNSQIDVVQSVGRVMRRAPGKKYGYIIIPVVIPKDTKPEEELSKIKDYAVVWTVLNALRAHDDRFDAEVNKLDLNRKSERIIVSPVPNPSDLPQGDKPEVEVEVEPGTFYGANLEEALREHYGEYVTRLYAQMVEKVGTRAYWEIWAKDIADVAVRHQFRIQKLITERADCRAAFSEFIESLKRDINPSIAVNDVIEMLAQHIITRPIFEALFENYSFTANNPVSRAMEHLLELLHEDVTDEERKKTDEIYESIRNRCSGITNAEGRQRVIIELYNKFFMAAFKKTVDKLGIVYTPVEIVDFILRSADDILRREFGRSLTDENVHILDPFTGTGTFITRLLQSGLIAPADLKRKYEHEIHANEIVLLAYYIASINIENVYHDVSRDDSYSSFNGICLTDTFNSGEVQGKVMTSALEENSARVLEQRDTPIQVIVGNPPYSAGQGSANDDAQNEHYEHLEGRIAETYAKYSKSINKNSLYDSYIKAFRWASDRISPETGGIIAFVSNGSWLDDNSKSGVRKSFEKEFSKIYVFNLRGNQRTSGELSRREGGKIFGSGSRAPISITILVKKPDHTETGKAEILYHDIGDYLSREEKLKIIKGSRSALSGEISWTRLEPNEYDDWINKRSTQYAEFPVLGDKKGESHETYFVPHYSSGCETARDAWVYNFSSKNVEKNMRSMIDFYNNCVKSRAASGGKDITHTLDGFDINDATKIGWSAELRRYFEKRTILEYNSDAIRTAMYRPFVKSNLYFDRSLNKRVFQIPQLFPTPNHENRLICVSGIGALIQSVIMVDCIPDLNMLAGGTQCFPLYYYEKAERKVQASLFGSSDENSADEYGYIRRSGVSEYIVRLARKKYDRPGIKDEDIFYYVYGMLHSRDYRKRFASDLKKSLPRLPLVESYEDFCTISRIGRELGNMHTDYENERRANVEVQGTGLRNFRVSEMRFGRTADGKEDKSRIIYNGFITISDIPLSAYDYVVNGKSAIEWLMERYSVTTDKKSNLTNNPNDWADEHGNPRYILDLLLSVISLSVRTMELVDKLPKLSFDEE